MKHLLTSTRCIDGRTMRHDPQPDDPGLETDIGRCDECDGVGCDQRHRALAEEIAGGKIVTHYWPPPIPPCEFDWCAWRDNDEPDDDGHMLQGWGRTEQAAIDDLISLIEDSRD